MSIEAYRAVWSESRAQGSARLIMLCIADHADKCGVAWPSEKTMAKETLVSERQVKRVIPQLVKMGELAIEERPHGRGNTAVYRIVLPSLTTRKGDMVSPITHNEKGDTMSQKGDMVSGKGDMVSDPSRTIIESSMNREESERPVVHTSGAAADFQDRIEEMIAALATVTRLDQLLKREKLRTEALELVHAGYTAEQVKAAFSPGGYWYVMSYGAKNSRPPALGNISTEIRLAIEWDGKAPPVYTNGHGSTKPDKQQLLADLRHAVNRTYGRRGYKRAMAEMDSAQKAIIAKMGKWEALGDMNEKQFEIAFYRALNEVSHAVS